MTPTAKVRLWADKARLATIERDAAIAAMHAEGATLRAIGDAAGLSHTAVAKIVARQAAS